jgi:hypothetical protein
MKPLTNVLPDSAYQELRIQGAELTKSWKAGLAPADMARLDGARIPLVIPRGNWRDYRVQEAMEVFLNKCREREAIAREMVKAMVLAKHPTEPSLFQKAGVSSALGYNFYDLRPPVMMIFPVNTPMRASIPRVGPVNAGVGTFATWNAVTSPGYPYGGASEGHRVQARTPNRIPYVSPYREIGSEGEVTLTAQFAGEGYVDNLADEHLRGLFGLWLQEEGMIWGGNSGFSNKGNGFQFNGSNGLTATPVPSGGTVTTHTVGAAGNLGTAVNAADLPYTAALTNSQYVSVAVVLLTAMGNPANAQYGYGLQPTISTGLTPSFSRTNADGSKDTIPGGMSAISAIATPVEALSAGSQLTVKFSIPAASLPVKGCFGYAWFVDVEATNTGSLANAKFAGITEVPYCYVSGTATGVQVGTYSGLSTDNSYNPLDFDGMFSLNINYNANYGTVTNYGWTDLYGASLTAQKNSRVTEIENILLSVFEAWQCGIDEIWCSPDAAENLDQAIRWQGTDNSGMQIFFTRDQLNNLVGGFVVSAYQSRYAINNPTGANAIPIKIHPMVPPGTMYFHIKTNPYPHSRVPFTTGMILQRDYYSIEWPQVTREWTFGTYTHEALAQMLPGIPWVLTGIGPFVGG